MSRLALSESWTAERRWLASTPTWLIRVYTPTWLRAAGLTDATCNAACNAAWAAVWDAAWAAVWDAAWAALASTVSTLQASAHDLVERMLSMTEQTRAT